MKNFLFISILYTVSILALTGCNNNSEKENPSIDTEKSTEIISEMYTEEELQTAKDLITENINHWYYDVENLKVKYDWDSLSKDYLPYCQNKNQTYVDSASFSASFYIPEQEESLPGMYDGKRDVDSYAFFLCRTEGWEWEIVGSWLW